MENLEENFVFINKDGSPRWCESKHEKFWFVTWDEKKERWSHAHTVSKGEVIEAKKTAIPEEEAEEKYHKPHRDYVHREYYGILGLVTNKNKDMKEEEEVHQLTLTDLIGKLKSEMNKYGAINREIDGKIQSLRKYEEASPWVVADKLEQLEQRLPIMDEIVILVSFLQALNLEAEQNLLHLNKIV